MNYNSMEKELAARLYKKSNSSQDLGYVILSAFSLLKEADVDNVLQAYEKIISGELVIADVVTSVELGPQQKQQIISKLTSLFTKQELVFLFSLEQGVEKGIKIKVGDDSVQFSFNS